MNSTINNKQKNNFTLFRFFLLCIIFITLGFGVNTYSNYTYNNNMNEFYSTFNKYDFDKALNIIDTTSNSNILKKKQLKADLNSYFTGIVGMIIESIASGDMPESDAISILSEIKKYDILNSSLDNLLASLDSNYKYNPTSKPNSNNTNTNIDNNDTDSSITESDNLTLGIEAFENKDYSTAISYFNKISKSSSSDFNKAKDYILNCKKNYKTHLLAEAEELIANKYYTDAIAFLSSYDTSILSSEDKDISNKINSVEMFRDEYKDHIQAYPNDASTYASSAILQTININNVNNLNIESKTPYFIYLSLSDQTTYIYEGSLNNWKLAKSFSSSTGIPGEETPKGIFSVNGRDSWFFSNEFQQGGKYWVRFMGDYLFHSLPFDEKQTKIVDETLGTAASHGCVRLKVEDSKWIYDNIDDGTKVIIN
ncbi:L,D-transpeptidase [Clostridium gasigenes]|uniref:L,D-transpeptidase n=1 Tax=Clostridium gasigenes TaxID=94869 RepID=UPI001C0E85E7|nr:L,D-transpeptidase [Clostridium gasigenes]MBU3137990.1 L,D-transpeptidase [Clostridium gasigenes]